MKKKWFAGLGIVVLALGIGTAAYAESNHMSFQEMLPFMEQMHPEATNQLNENCHRDQQEINPMWENVIMGTQIGMFR